jgi:predicted enzyme related to lactoylglutathione lyase
MAKKMVCQAQPLIAVKNVPKSSKFYQQVLQCKSGHGGKEYEQLIVKDRMILQLHRWEVEHNHGNLIGKEKQKSRGNGTVLWFMVDDFDRSVKAIKKSKAKILKDVEINENANHREIWFNDPDGYVVVVAGHYGDI